MWIEDTESDRQKDTAFQALFDQGLILISKSALSRKYFRHTILEHKNYANNANENFKL